MCFALAPGVKRAATPERFSDSPSLDGIVPPPEKNDLGGLPFLKQGQDPLKTLHVGAGKDGQPDGRHVFLDRGAHDLLRGSTNARVDDFVARISQHVGHVFPPPGRGHPGPAWRSGCDGRYSWSGEEFHDRDGTPLVIAVGAEDTHKMILANILSRGYVPGVDAWFVA